MVWGSQGSWWFQVFSKKSPRFLEKIIQFYDWANIFQPWVGDKTTNCKYTLRIQVCPKKGIGPPTILLWECD